MDYNKQLFYAIKDNNINEVNNLIKKGADVNIKAITNNDINLANFDAPLMYAIQNKNLEIAAILISNGADVNAENFFNKNIPLHLASINGDLEICRLFSKIMQMLILKLLNIKLLLLMNQGTPLLKKGLHLL